MDNIASNRLEGCVSCVAYRDHMSVTDFPGLSHMISFHNQTELRISLAYLHTQHKRWQPKESPLTLRPAYRSLAICLYLTWRTGCWKLESRAVLAQWEYLHYLGKKLPREKNGRQRGIKGGFATCPKGYERRICGL